MELPTARSDVENPHNPNEHGTRWGAARRIVYAGPIVPSHSPLTGAYAPKSSEIEAFDGECASLIIAYGAGLRVSEVANLKVSDIPGSRCYGGWRPRDWLS